MERINETYQQVAPPGTLFCILTLPDFITNEIKEGVVTDVGIDGHHPKSFKVYLTRVRSHILEEVMNTKKTPHIEQINYEEGKQIIKRHVELGLIARKYNVPSGLHPDN